MRRFVVYATLTVTEIAWSVFCLYTLSGLRKDPLLFFETIIIWFVVSILIGRSAGYFSQGSHTYGKFQSNIEHWDQLRKEMREDQKNQRRYGA